MKKQVLNLQVLHQAANTAKQAIKKHAKHLLLACGLIAGGYAVANEYMSSDAVGLAFTIGIVARCKKAGITLDEGTEKFLAEIDAEVNKAFADAKEQTISKSDLDKVISDNAEKIAGALDITKIKIGEKSLDTVLRDLGTEVKQAIDNSTSEEVKKTFEQMIEEKMGDIENMMKTKNGKVEISTKAAAIMTVDNTTDVTTNTIPRDLIESMSLSAFAGARYGRQFISEIADRTTVQNMEQYTTWLEEGDEQGAFAVVAEGALKPLTSYALVRNYAEAQKVAGKYVVTEEFAKFRQSAYTIIKRLIMDKMLRDYQALLVTALNAAAAAYTGTILDDTIAAPNDVDAIGAVCAQIESLNFIPNVLVLNPQDKWRIRLSKDNDGRYLFPMTLENGDVKMVELTVVTTTYQTAGYFTVAEAGLFKIEEEAITVRIGYGITDNGGTIESDFDHNRLRVIVETFFKSYLPTPYVGSVVRTQFSTVKTALLAPAE